MGLTPAGALVSLAIKLVTDRGSPRPSASLMGRAKILLAQPFADVAELRPGKFFHRPHRHRHLLEKMTIRKQDAYPFDWGRKN